MENDPRDETEFDRLVIFGSVIFVFVTISVIACIWVP